MKKTTFLMRFLGIIILGFLSVFSIAGNIHVSDNQPTQLKINESTYNILQLSNSVADIQEVMVKTKGGYYTLLNIPEYAYSDVVGYPQLPVLKKLIEVPIGADYSFEIVSGDYTEFDLADYGVNNLLLPVQAPLSKSADPDLVDFAFNPAAYQVDEFSGPEMLQVIDLGIIRGVRIARVEISPVLYNPIQNKIRIYQDIQLKINFEGGDIEATIAAKTSKFSPFYQSVFSQLINFKPLVNGDDLIMDEPVTFIIVSDPMFEAALQPFIEWKTTKGFKVVEAYTNDPNVGTTTTSIHNYLQNFYNNPPAEYNAQSFVLIVGDVAQIPTYNGTSGSHVSDLYYYTYDGSGDIYPECFYGRFSANNLTELQPQIDKTLQYENYTFPDPSFLNEVVMVAGADAGYQTWSNGQINYGTTYYFNEAHGITSHTYLQPEPGGGNYSQNIRQNISDGVAFGNYTAHCSSSGWADPSFTTSNIAALTNQDKYPLLVGNCCLSVKFEGNCFGEEILRAANKGAVGYIGGSNSTYWDEDYWWGVGNEPPSLNPVYHAANLGSYDRTFHDHSEPIEEWFVTQGQMVTAGDMAVTQAGSSMETYYWEIYHLMGDPSLMIYYSVPDDTPATYAGLMPLAATTFTVNTDPYGYVAISKDGELNGVGLANSAGMAIVNMFNPIVVPGIAQVTITGQNMKPYFGDLTVASPTGAYVLLDEFEIDDSNGNNNGNADFGEYIMLDVVLNNMGSITATNLTATISTTDVNVSIDVDSHNWPDIAAGATSAQTGAFAFTVNDVIPDQHNVSFDIEITDGTDVWTGTFNQIINAPVLTVGSYTIDDSEGNNNGRMDPGETVNVFIHNMNDGGCDALSSFANMTNSNPLFTLNNTSFDLGNIASGDSQDAIFNISINPAAPIGDVVTVGYMLSSNPYSTTAQLSFTVGLIVEDFETGDFTAFPWEFSGNTNWQITNTTPYEGIYSAKSGTISHSQNSSMLVSASVSTDDQISFYYKVSSESNYDYLRFYIDGSMQDEWSGEVGWTEASYDVSSGEHTFKWEYMKDGSVSSGGDAAWVDFIVFPAIAGSSPLAVIASATPSTICAGDNSQLYAFAMGGNGAYTYSWLPVTGLSDPTIANPVATPVVTTTYYVVVSDGDNNVNDNTLVTVNPTPDQAEITQSGINLVSSADYGNQWYDSNGAIPGATDKIFAPTVTDYYYVIVSNSSGCESIPSDSYYFIYTGLIEFENGQNINLFPNPFYDQFTLDYSLVTPSNVTINIYNTFGQKVVALENNDRKLAGNHRIRFNAGQLDSGIYFLKIETSDYSITKRIVHSK